MSVAYQSLNILTSIKAALAQVATTIYLNDRPSATTAQKDSFAVVKLGDTYGLGAYGDSYITVKLFSKDVDGLERVNILADMESKVYQALPINNSLFYTQKPHTLQSKSDGSGFHYLTVYFDLILK